MEPLFVVAKIIGSSGKNDCLLFHSKLFYVRLWYLWLLYSFDRHYDHCGTAFGNTQI